MHQLQSFPTRQKRDHAAEADKAAYQAWRAEVVQRLNDAGRYGESARFGACGSFLGNFQVLACEGHPEHEARAIPFSCHLRYCPDCERRAQAKRVAYYVPKLQDLADDVDHETWSLKKIELTTPYKLTDPDAPALYEQAWRYFEKFQQIIFMRLLADELTPGEKRRGRISFRKHGVGSLVSAEFGERGRKLHFHMITFAPYIKKQMITDCWREATDGECEVNWIRRIDYGQDVEKAVKEQVKYVTKFNNLPARLIPALAAVLDGQRRFRTYGVIRKSPDDPPVEKEPCKCKVCSNVMTLIRVREYVAQMLSRNFEPDPAIISLASPAVLLDLKLGNKSGESDSLHLPRSDPDTPFLQDDLPGFNAVFRPDRYR